MNWPQIKKTKSGVPLKFRLCLTFSCLSSSAICAAASASASLRTLSSSSAFFLFIKKKRTRFQLVSKTTFKTSRLAHSKSTTANYRV